jgi:4-azaleucine resistance transporter AzlC
MIGRSTWQSDAELRSVVTASITLGLATGVFAISFGVGAVSTGASIAQTCTMSLLVFTGASQFSLVSVLGAGGSAASALAGAGLLAVRNGVYGLSMAPHLFDRGGPEGARHTLGRRLLAAQLVLDETTAMATAQQDLFHRRAAFWITGFSVYFFWNLGTLVGALAGSAIDPKTFGLDAAFPAAFVAMLWPSLRDERARLAAGLGAVICLVLIPFVPVGIPVLCSALAILVGIPAPEPAPAEPRTDGRA